jgi:hypothetical protein
MTEVDASRYFGEHRFVESVVLRAHRDLDGLWLACLYLGDEVNDVVSRRRHTTPARDLRLLRFDGVSDFIYNATSRLHATWSDFDAATDRRSYASMTRAPQTKHHARGVAIGLDLGPRGRISFVCRRLFEARRTLVAVAGPRASPIYVDAVSRDVVDFYAPFEITDFV